MIITQFCVGVGVVANEDVTEGVTPLTEEDRVGVLVKVTVGVGVSALSTLKDKVNGKPLVNDVVPESTIVRPLGLLTPSITKLFVVLSVLKTVESDVL